MITGKRATGLILLVLMMASAAFPTLANAQSRRIALVIANSRYTNASTLPNPPSDARLIAESLRRAGFQTVDVRVDLGKTALEAALRDFGAKSEGADVAMVYYAGHGIEAGGQNYLIPTDAVLARDRDLDIEATRLDTVLLMGEGARMRLIVLDACRNNPFAASMQRTMKTRAIGRGLASVEPEGETLVVYAAKAGATASDGSGANSPFATALAKRLPEPGLEISLLFRAVRDDVLKMTGRVQEPFTYGSLSGNAFYFVGPTTVNITQTNPITTQPQPVVSAQASEALFWQGAMNANSEASYREYLRRYPKGEFAELARQNVTGLTRPRPSPPVGSGVSGPSQGSASAGVFGAGLSIPQLIGIRPLPSANAGADEVRRFAFTPQSSVRARAKSQFITQLKTTNPPIAGIFEALMSAQDLFALSDREIAKYGITTSNLADTTALFIDQLRGIAIGNEADSTYTQSQAIRRQMALELARSPATNAMSAAQMQELSDSMVLNSLFLAMAKEAGKADPAAAKQFSDGVWNLAKVQFGIDLRQLRVTDQGWVF